MNVEELTAFLGWSMVVNFGLLLFWVVAIKATGDLAYRMQRVFVSIEKDEWERQMYGFLANFKLGVILLNFTPYIALRIVY